MKLAKLVSLLGILAMTAVLIYGFMVGDFFNEGSQLVAMPWGIVSLVDLYTGFILFSAWIIHSSLLPTSTTDSRNPNRFPLAVRRPPSPSVRCCTL